MSPRIALTLNTSSFLLATVLLAAGCTGLELAGGVAKYRAAKGTIKALTEKAEAATVDAELQAFMQAVGFSEELYPTYRAAVEAKAEKGDAAALRQLRILVRLEEAYLAAKANDPLIGD